MQIDRDAPTLAQVVADSPMADLVPFRIAFNEPVTGLDASSFVVTGLGCTISKLDGGGTQYQLWLQGCSETPMLTIKANSVTDSAGNRGPLIDVVNGSGSIDETGPSVTFHETSRQSRGVSPSFEITFSEHVDGFSLNSLVRTGTAKNCTFALTEILSGLSYQLQSSECSAGTLRIAIPEKTVSDAAGNLGPIIATESALVSIDFTPTQKTEAAVNISSVPKKSETIKGDALEPSSVTVSRQAAATPSAKSESFEALAVRAIEQVPGYGWVGLAALIIGVRLSRRLIRR